MAIVPATITAWSFSRWQVYDECPYRAKLKFLERRPEPSSPAGERGDLVHKSGEGFLLNPKLRKVPEGFTKFATQLRELRKCGAQPELQLTFTKNFEAQTGWFESNAWCRIKIDALVPLEDSRVVDYKTGKVHPEKHRLQGELYGLGGLLIDPRPIPKRRTTVEFWYLDHGPQMTEPVTYTGKDLPALKKAWLTRTKAMLTDRTFKPKPGAACRYCHFSKARGGPCKY